jgi:ParB/RepB/Spo0J family partition protein
MSTLLYFEVVEPITRHARTLRSGAQFSIKSSSSRVHVERWLQQGKIRALDTEPMHQLAKPAKAPKKTPAASRSRNATGAVFPQEHRENAENIENVQAADPIARGGTGYQVASPLKIGRSPFNRSHFNEEKLKELTDDVRERGVLQPLIVRKNPGYQLASDGNAWKVQTIDEQTVVERHLGETEARVMVADLNRREYELIAGERRWRASTRAQLQQVPIIVREASDREAIEDQAVENLHREDLNPLEEAEKYQQLLEAYKGDGTADTAAVEMVATKLQRSKSLVYGRLKLLTLPRDAKEALLEGRLPSSHAELLTTIDDAAMQEEATQRILKPKNHEMHDGDEPDTPLATMSFREAKRLVEQKKEELKRRRAYNKTRDEFVAKKQTVLSDAENKKLFRNDWSHSPEDGSGYVAIDDRCTDADWKEWKKVLGKHAPAPVLAQRPDGEAVICYRLAEAKEALKKTGIKPRPSNSSRSASDREKDAAHKARSKAFIGLLAGVAAAGEQMDGPELWRFVFESVMRFGNADGVRRVCKRRGVVAKQPHELGAALREAMKNATGKELRGVIAELLFNRFAPSTWSSGWEKDFEASCELFGVQPLPWKQEVHASGKGSK